MILIIDDNKDLANIYGKFFTLAGHEVSVAYGGEEGIAKAKEQKPDVILCDIAMAGLNGYTVAQRLREDPELQQAYLVAISGYGSEQDVERSLEAGFDQHLCKPVSFEIMLQTLEERQRRQG